MAEKPILFSTEMVRAILDGRKTQTRRIIKLPKSSIDLYVAAKIFPIYLTDSKIMPREIGDRPIKEPCQPGDILWVRETWQNICAEPAQYAYKADGEFEPYSPWKPSIHMPKEATRLFLRVTNVRVERLQDISERDAKAEGMEFNYNPGFDFMCTWNSIYAKRGYGWDANPWVFVVEFERIQP